MNAEDPDAVVRVGRMALDYRYVFGTPVVIDLIGYRRHGHSEVDDPDDHAAGALSQDRGASADWRIYAEKIGVDPEPVVQRVRAELDAAQEEAQEIEKVPSMRRLPRYWGAFRGGRYDASLEVDTAVAAGSACRRSAEALASYPDGFHIHPKVKKLLEQRLRNGAGQARRSILAWPRRWRLARLLKEGVPVRLSGQDSRRGTFNQRHAALIDIETEEEYVPLEHLRSRQAWCEIYNSPLSEAAVLGFEYGFSRDFPEALVLWEAQFGDFANGAQIIIDQFIAASEDKWNLLSGIVMLLPHGYEGQGPEHSSARIERYLQLAARDNIQICQPPRPRNIFICCGGRRCASWRKPLVVFTPKSMLRNPAASSPLADFSRARFHNRDSRRGRRLGRARAAVHGQNRSRARSGTKAASGKCSGDCFCRAARAPGAPAGFCDRRTWTPATPGCQPGR